METRPATGRSNQLVHLHNNQAHDGTQVKIKITDSMHHQTIKGTNPTKSATTARTRGSQYSSHAEGDLR